MIHIADLAKVDLLDFTHALRKCGLFEILEMKMERAVAIKKLGKILGKSLGYRIDPRAPNQEERDAAQAELREVVPKREALSKAVDARRAEILQADAEYQRLKAEHKEAREACDRLFSITHHYRFTVGVSNSMFFTVHAQGDSWEQVIEKLTVKEAA